MVGHMNKNKEVFDKKIYQEQEHESLRMDTEQSLKWASRTGRLIAF